jgi:uncharacterized protein YecE (DUF72 family)
MLRPRSVRLTLTVWIGTSGWHYRDWRRAFYPGSMPKESWLEWYASAFATVESNNAFYRLPERRQFEEWADRSPDDFVMAVKVSRYLSHIKRLRDPEEPIGRFLERVGGLGSKLGPVLLQLPPTLRADVPALSAVLELVPADVRVAVEFRHDSWFSDRVRAVLEHHRAALCLADRRGVRAPLWRTADWTYVRFHEGRARPGPCYGRTALRTWAERLAGEWEPSSEIFAYFNNDPRACAPRDAARFAIAVERVGLRPSRVPPVRSVRPGTGP